MSVIARWDLPSIDAAQQPAADTVPSPTAAMHAPPTVAHLEDIERAAYEEAFARGKAEGLAAAEQQLQALRVDWEQRLSVAHGLLDALASPLALVDEEVEQQLAMLALSVARQLVRRELRIDPAQVIAIIRETAALLPAAARDVRVQLHPLDAALVRDKLAAPGQTPAWCLVEDPVLARGDCRISSASAHIDARLETRLQSAASVLLGEERATAQRGVEPAS